MLYQGSLAALSDNVRLLTLPLASEIIYRVASHDYHVDQPTTANFSAFDGWARDLSQKGLLPPT